MLDFSAALLHTVGMKQPYARPPFPRELFKKFNKVAKKLGYKLPGDRWKLFGYLLDDALKFPQGYEKTFTDSVR